MTVVDQTLIHFIETDLRLILNAFMVTTKNFVFVKELCWYFINMSHWSFITEFWIMSYNISI